MTITLPTTPRERPAPSIDGDTFLVYGPPKSGKTSLVSSWPNCLLIDCERGARKHPGLVVDVLGNGPDPIATLREILGSLKRACPYQAVALDTIDAAARWFEPRALASLNEKHRRGQRPDRPLYTNIADIEYGAGHAEHRTMVLAMIEAFVALPCQKILIGHSKTLITDELGASTKVLDLPGKLGHIVPSLADHLGLARVDPALGYTVTFKGYEVETRGGHSVTHAGSRVRELDGQTVLNNYSAIVGALNGHDPH